MLGFSALKRGRHALHPGGPGGVRTNFWFYGLNVPTIGKGEVFLIIVARKEVADLERKFCKIGARTPYLQVYQGSRRTGISFLDWWVKFRTHTDLGKHSMLLQLVYAYDLLARQGMVQLDMQFLTWTLSVTLRIGLKSPLCRFSKPDHFLLK